MNSIKGLLDKSDYEGYYDCINFYIDDYWLDEKLDELYPGSVYKGLIPTLVYWLDRESENKVVWERILPIENEISVCPILMCPDDCDFSCTLIVAEIQNYGEFIQWKRLGIDETRDWDAERAGTKVKWFDHFKEVNFRITDYLEMIDEFKDQLKKDKLRIENQIDKSL